MNKHVQIRDLKATVHERLTENASDLGLSLSQYLRQELELLASRSSSKDVFRQLRNLPRKDNVGFSASDTVRQMRDDRAKDIADIVSKPTHKL